MFIDAIKSADLGQGKQRPPVRIIAISVRIPRGMATFRRGRSAVQKWIVNQFLQILRRNEIKIISKSREPQFLFYTN